MPKNTNPFLCAADPSGNACLGSLDFTNSAALAHPTRAFMEGQQAKCVADVIDYAEKKHPENILVFINIGLMDNLI